MKANLVLVADSAAAYGGRLYIHGGGWDVLTAETFPLRLPTLAVATRLDLADSEMRLRFNVAVDVLDGDSKSILAERLSSEMIAGHTGPPLDDVAYPVCVSFTLGPTSFPKAGDFRVVIYADNKEIGGTTIHARQRAARETTAATPAGERRQWKPKSTAKA